MISDSKFPILLRSLDRATRERPHARKLLLCSRPAEGRELLRSLALSGVPWLGWEPLSLRQLALTVAGGALAVAELRVADAFDVMAVVDAAIDEAVAEGGARPFRGGVPGPYRDPIRRSVETLRAAGLGASALRRAESGDGRLDLLARVLERYEAGLSASALVDGPGLLARAEEALGAGGVPEALAGARLHLLPGLDAGGVAGRLVARLMELGARVLETDATPGAPTPAHTVWAAPAEPEGGLSWLSTRLDGALPPSLEAGGLPGGLHLFAAATPADEVREVLRRVVAAGVPWDRVEIIATDADVYGNALDGLARRLGIPVSYAEGLDIRRTRAGRVAEAYFRWLADGFPADVIRRLLETGDVAPPGPSSASASALARRLRRLRIGWGYDRYLPAIDRALEAAAGASPREGDGDPEAAADALARERTELKALRSLLAPVLEATPRLADRHAIDTARTSPARLAGGLLELLALVPPGDEVERAAKLVLGERLERARATLDRETGWRTATAMLRARLRTRISPAGDDGQLSPWTSAGGRLHLSDIASGGLAARPHTFVVGLAAGAVGPGASDPMLPDRERAALGLPTTADRLAASRHALASVLARLRGSVTLSYAAWDMAEGRVVAPAPELLQALRLLDADPSRTYEDLRKRLGRLACAVPAEGAGALDAADVWLDALSAPDGLLRDGAAAVRTLYPGLAAGLGAGEARRASSLTAWDGRVAPDPALDPRRSGVVHSASRLEALGACPLRYFYRYVLDARPVRDPGYDPESWLDALERGSLLHAVYEHAVVRAGVGADYGGASFEALAMDALEDAVHRTLRRLPSPSEAVLRSELLALQDDVRSFVVMLRDRRPRVVRTELAFGPETDAESEGEVELSVPGGRLRLRGRVDRLDALDGGGLRVVDYKTGRPSRYREALPFDGGRRLQHLLYSLAVEQLRPGERVGVMEYHFPTARGENHVTRYHREQLEPGGEVLRMLLQLAADGLFIPTDDDGDCRYCDFGAVCRVTTNDWGSADSPRARWAKESGMLLPEYAPLVQLRGGEVEA